MGAATSVLVVTAAGHQGAAGAHLLHQVELGDAAWQVRNNAAHGRTTTSGNEQVIGYARLLQTMSQAASRNCYQHTSGE